MGNGARYVLCFGAPLATVVLITPLVALLARRLGMIDHPGAGKTHRAPTPYLGGAAVAAGLAVVAAPIVAASAELLAILLGALILGVLGLVDDRRALRPGPKLLVEVAAAVGLWLVGVRAGLFGMAILDLGLTVLWVVAVTNAVNLLDNMDGLATGVAAIAAVAFFAVAVSRGDEPVGALALAVAGSCAGFLIHNFPPAKVFLGDAGALMLGFLLAALGLELDLVGHHGPTRSFVPILILAVPLIDTTFVVLRRLRERRPLARGGTDHSSHLLAGLGLSHRSVAMTTYTTQVAGCGAALVLLEASSGVALGLLLGSATAALAVLAALLLLAENRAPIVVEDLRPLPPEPRPAGRS
jgi:UDP-GlcNAc:undecaprenyl-phosphate GlcNAc-1-phosphate transferase